MSTKVVTFTRVLFSFSTSIFLAACGGPQPVDSDFGPASPPPISPTGGGGGEIPPDVDSGLGGFDVMAVATDRALASSDTDGGKDVYLINPKTNVATLVRPTSMVGTYHYGDNPSISSNGRFVTFNFTEYGDPDVFRSSIWRLDRVSGTVLPASTTVTGVQPTTRFGLGSEESAIGNGGRLIAFASWAQNLISGETSDSRNIFLKNLESGAVIRLSRPTGGGPLVNPERIGNDFTAMPRMTPSESMVVFASNAKNLSPEATDGEWDVFSYSTQTGLIEKISKTASGADVRAHAWDPDVSDDGRFVSFATLTNYYQNFDYGAVNARAPACPGVASNDPQYTNVTWLCAMTQIYVKDRQTGVVENASVTDSGESAVCGHTGSARLSSDGRYVAFISSASNLLGMQLTADQCFYSHSGTQVFVHDRLRQTTRQISKLDGESLKGPCYKPQISPDGLEIAFMCKSSLKASENLPENQWQESLFVVRTITGAIRRVF